MWRNNSLGYGWVSIGFHWLLAVAIIGLFALGAWMVTLGYYSPWYHDAPAIHKSVGVLTVGAMVFRWLWMLWPPQPSPASQKIPAWQNAAASAVHATFYLLVLGLGVSGYLIAAAEGHPVSVFGWFEVPVWIEPFEQQADRAGELHQWLAYSLMGLVALHALAALKHHFIDRDRTLVRMLRPERNKL